MKRQSGYLLLLAVLFILVMGLMGTIMVSLFAERAVLSTNQLLGLKTFYNAESGLNIATHYLLRENLVSAPIRLACGSINGYSELTNASLNGGTFTATTINSSPLFASNTLNGAITASTTSITATSASGFAPAGRITIDREAIDYTSISGNAFQGVTRATGGTLAASHANGAGIGQYQCSLNVDAGIPSIAAPVYQRELNQNVQLQNGYAVGVNNGNNLTIMDWNKMNEVAWTSNALTVSAANTTTLRAISMVSNVYGWATGDRIAAGFPLLSWNGSTWTFTTLAGACSGQHLLGISMVSATQGFAVGARYRAACAGSGPFRYTILYWNGSAWSLLTPSTVPSIPADNAANVNLNAVHVIDTNGDGNANLGFAVGNGGIILHYNGSNWVNYTSPTTVNLSGVYTVSASEAWAVGTGGVILRWNGSAWSTFTSGLTTALNGISMLDTNGDGLADFGVIAASSARILTYNGSSWSFQDLGSATFNAADIFSDKDAWVVGTSGLVYHYEGATWVAYTSNTTSQLTAISLVRPGKPARSSWQQIFH